MHSDHTYTDTPARYSHEIITIFSFANIIIYIVFKINDRLYIHQYSKIFFKTILINRILENIKYTNENSIIIKNILIKLNNNNTIPIYPYFDLRIDNIIKNIYKEILNNKNTNTYILDKTININYNSNFNRYIFNRNLNKMFTDIYNNNKLKSYNYKENEIIYEYKKNKINYPKLKSNININIDQNKKDNINKKNKNNKNIKENQDNNNNNNNNNPNLNYTNSNNINYNNYINHKFINNVINKLNIDNKDVIKIDVKSDGNCFMRCISLFVNNENYHLKIREEIQNFIEINKSLFNHLEIETEVGILNIEDYIIYIKKPKSWSGELEKYSEQELYNINIADYIVVIDDTNNNIYHKFFTDCNHDNNYEKNLCILTSIANSHYNLLYDKKYNCFKNKNNYLIFLNTNNYLNSYRNNNNTFKVNPIKKNFNICNIDSFNIYDKKRKN